MGTARRYRGEVFWVSLALGNTEEQQFPSGQHLVFGDCAFQVVCNIAASRWMSL